MGATVRACLLNDASCLNELVPDGVSTSASAGNPQPTFSMGLPRNFQGFLRLQATATDPVYVTQDWYLQGPVARDIQNPQPFLMLSQSSLVEFVGGLGVDPMKPILGLGVLAVYVLDCDGNLAPGVTLRLPDLSDAEAANVIPWGINRGIPVLDQPTDVSGIAGFIGLPLRNLVIEAEVNGRRFGNSPIPVRALRLTTGAIRPSYASAL
jgi:hypothetical protein